MGGLVAGRERETEGCILHSDRGSTYTSNEYIEKMNEYGLVGSMSRTGNCWDNAPIESFWGRMKMEWIEGLYKMRQEAIFNKWLQDASRSIQRIAGERATCCIMAAMVSSP